MKRGKARVMNLVGILVDGLYDNGRYNSGLPEHFLPHIPENEVNWIRNCAFATNLVKSVRVYDIDLGEEYDTKEVMLTDKGMWELSVHGSFKKYRRSWRQVAFRFWFTFIRPIGNLFKIGWDGFGRILTPINTLTTILMTLVTIFLTIRQYRKDKTMELIIQDNASLNRTVDSLNNIVNYQQQEIRIEHTKDSLEINEKTLPK